MILKTILFSDTALRSGVCRLDGVRSTRSGDRRFVPDEISPHTPPAVSRRANDVAACRSRRASMAATPVSTSRFSRRQDRERPSRADRRRLEGPRAPVTSRPEATEVVAATATAAARKIPFIAIPFASQ